MTEWTEEKFAIARAWCVLADLLRADNKERFLAPHARGLVEHSELELRRIVFDASTALAER